MAKRNTNYDVLDKILQDSQIRESAGKVWVSSPNHPDGGYWCDPGEANASWETLKSTDDIERYLRS